MESLFNMDICRKPAVFLDRDGVLTEEKSYICTVSELTVFSYAGECIREIKDRGYYAIVITNQSGIARGLFTEVSLQLMNEHLIRMLGVDDVYYCPHHPQGKVEKYRKACECRKPGIGLITHACRDYNIDMDRSYMVGDRASDIIAGQRAGLKTVLLESGYGTAGLEADVAPDYVLADLRGMLPLL